MSRYAPKREGEPGKSVSKDTKKQGLIEKAGQLFFRGGKNAEESLTDFEIDITDFQQHPLGDTITVCELYEKTKLPLLRFYLTTKKRDITSEENSDAISANASSERVSLLYTTVNPMAASSSPEHGTLLDVEALMAL